MIFPSPEGLSCAFVAAFPCHGLCLGPRREDGDRDILSGFPFGPFLGRFSMSRSPSCPPA